MGLPSGAEQHLQSSGVFLWKQPPAGTKNNDAGAVRVEAVKEEAHVVASESILNKRTVNTEDVSRLTAADSFSM